ncbi:Cnl2/NKP2 family domain containing protein [Elaphomyces granulatus]
MAPSEESILTNFLLSPASLPTIISLQKFTELFPRRLQSHPQIRLLYRELQERRSQDMDLVRENIKAEVDRGGGQKAELRKALKTSGVDGTTDSQQREVDMDFQLIGEGPKAHREECHTLSSLLTEMENAGEALQQEIATAERDATTTLQELDAIVSELSDLRYGKFNKPAGAADDVVSETIKGLRSLEDACYNSES